MQQNFRIKWKAFPTRNVTASKEEILSDSRSHVIPRHSALRTGIGESLLEMEALAITEFACSVVSYRLQTKPSREARGGFSLRP